MNYNIFCKKLHPAGQITSSGSNYIQRVKLHPAGQIKEYINRPINVTHYKKFSDTLIKAEPIV